MIGINKNNIAWILIIIFIFVAGIFIVKKGIIKINPKEDNLEAAENMAKRMETPETVRGIYLTSTSAGNPQKIDWLISLAEKSELNSVIIDIKDFSGYVAYDSSVSLVDEYKTERLDIKDLDGLLARLHEDEIYVIARMTVFQDPALVGARPDWAVQNKYTKRPWQDRKGLSWIDPTNREAWKYYASIAKEASDRGFDEINFDYIRFPSDGDMSALAYSSWNDGTTRPQVLNEFYKYMRGELGDIKISADLFGFVTTRTEDFGVGQVMEDAFEYFDYISPMVYPSHYPPGFLKFSNPAEHPYEVVYFAMKSAGERLVAFKQRTGNTRPNLRPWLQDFKLGAEYTQAMVQAQIKATQDALGEQYGGYMIWNAGNNYHEGVLGQ